MLELSKISTDGGTQTRNELNQETVAEYAEAMKSGAKFPPIIVYFDKEDFWLAEGHHRVAAAKLAGLTEIYEEVTPGSQRDAILHSLGANASHGLRRTNDDKRRAVKMMLDDPEWSAWSSREIGKQCCVSHTFVEGVRNSYLATLPDRREDDADSLIRIVTRSGSMYQQNAGNIGKTPVALAPSSENTGSSKHPTTPVPINGSCEHIPDPERAVEIEELRDRCDQLAEALKETIADNESMGRIFEADDKILAALAEASRFREQNRVLESRINSLLSEKNEAVRAVISWKRRAEKAEAQLARMEADHAI